MARRIVIFNHKGGVSKTTSAYNIGWALSAKERVLLVDADPQCNLTSLVLDDFDAYYTDAVTSNQNIKDGVAPAFEGRPSPIASISCASPERAPNLFLVAGHPNLSEYDASLTFAHTSTTALATLQNLPGAFSELIRLTEERYNIDTTIIDLNPGLSAINQNMFLLSDAFIVPTNPDPFSNMALATLKGILPRWVAWKTSAEATFANSAYPLRPGVPKFVGSLIQRFNIRKGRAARPYRDNIDEIKNSVESDLVPALTRAGMMFPAESYAEIHNAGYCLGEIPDFQGLLPKAHTAGVPVFELTDAEIGETGPIREQAIIKRDQFLQQFSDISDRISRIIRYA